MKNSKSSSLFQASFWIFTFAFVLISCKGGNPNPIPPKPPENVLAKISLGGLGLSANVCLRIGFPAKVEWDDKKTNRSYLLFIPPVVIEKNTPNISGVLFQKSQDSWIAISDNLDKRKLFEKDGDIDFFNKKSRDEIIDIQIEGELIADTDMARMRFCSNSSNCCVVSCTNGNRMRCCNACCDDTAQGCPRCCSPQ